MKYYIDQKKYRIKGQEEYIRVNGWCFHNDGSDVKFIAEINGKDQGIIYKPVKREDVQKKYKKYPLNKKCGFNIKVYTDKIKDLNSFQLFALDRGRKKSLLKLNKQQIQNVLDDKTISYYIDSYSINDSEMSIVGWAVSVHKNCNVEFNIKQDRQEQEYKKEILTRKDVYESGMINQADLNCGFYIKFNFSKDKKYILELSDTSNTYYEKIDPIEIFKKQRYYSRKFLLKRALRMASFRNFSKLCKHIFKHGFKGLKKYILQRIKVEGKPYSEWFEEQLLSDEELDEQKKHKFSFEPKISIIVPTYNTPDNFLREMVKSVQEQTYSNWEICIGDGSGGNTKLETTLRQYAENDSRIKVNILEKNLGISGNTNAALDLATGDYIGLLDHDDVLAPNALFEVAMALQEDDYDILYTDEDKVSFDLKTHADPNFKPDFSIDLFCSHNYITHFFVVKSSIINGIGGFRSEFDGAQDYDLMFRCIENSSKIKHIPMILYYWRIHGDSVAGDPASKMYAYDAGKKAIQEHFERMGIKAKVEHEGLWGMYHVIYETPGDPLVSIIIPNKDHIDYLSTCITSIINKSIYKSIEFVIVENNSEDKETFDYYDKIQKQYNNVKVVKWEHDFNYSLINNFGVEHASGEYLLFLNNDTELITETGISEMLGCCMREDVGAVGAKLLYEDDTVQHAGVIIGFGGYAGHIFNGIGKDDYGFMVRARINCNYSAVTAACMMTKKSLFNQVGGFDERFKVACNDVDLCLKIRELGETGKMIVYNAFSHWYHYESKSRGYEDTSEKRSRFDGEVKIFQKKWKKILDEGDPFYNKNFAIDQSPFTLA